MNKNTKQMKIKKSSLFNVVLMFFMMMYVFIGCDSSENIEPTTEQLNGMAVAGAPIKGRVIIKDQNGKLTSCAIGEDGSFRVDVTIYTPPFVLWSEGSVNGSNANYYSTKEDSGYINVNPATHALLAIALKQDPSEYFESTNIPPDEQSINNAKKELTPILRELGDLPEDFDILTYEFEANKKGYDRVLETVEMKIEQEKVIIRPNNVKLTPYDLYEDPLTGSLYVMNLQSGYTEVNLAATEGLAAIKAIAEKNYSPIYNFPENFLWGAASASHQVDSNNTNNDWYAWETLNRIIEDHTNLDGPDHWNQYNTDFDFAKNIGTNAYRLTIEWSKVEPEPDQYSPAVIKHYHDILDALKARHIKPIVTLQHFTLPLWIHDPSPYTPNENKPRKPGWNDDSDQPYIIDRIVKFTKKMAEEFGSKVDWWITINEPLKMYANGYLIGDFPPGMGYKNELIDNDLPDEQKTYPLTHHPVLKISETYATETYGLKAGIQAAKIVLPNIIKAHIQMYDAIKEYDTVDADGDSQSSRVSISKNHVLFRPFVEDATHEEAINQMQYIWNEMIWNAIISGNLDSDLDHNTDSVLFTGDPKVDFIGCNYDTRRDVLTIEEISSLLGIDQEEFDFFKGFPLDTSITGELNEMLLGNHYDCMGCEIYPEGIKDVMNFYSTHYSHLPILITESGTDNNPDRPGFIVDMIEEIAESLQQESNIIGYLHWSLIDNFEWERGFGQKFGLVSIDKKNNRSLSEGGKAFSNIIMNNGVVPSLKEKYGTIDSPGNITNTQKLCTEMLRLPDKNLIQEIWETTLDSTKGSVNWAITKNNDALLVSGEGKYLISGYTVSFPIENAAAIVTDESVSYTGSGTAFLIEMPSMTSGFTYVLDGPTNTYTMFVDSTAWQGILGGASISGHAESTLVSGNGITSGIDATNWKATLDNGNVTWEIIDKADDQATVNGEGLYYISTQMGDYTVSFPFENIAATVSGSSMSFIATGTAVLKEMSTMTSGFTFKLDGTTSTFEISVDSPTWQGLLASHPIIGAAAIEAIPDEPTGPVVTQGDDSPLAIEAIGDFNILLRKNGTFSILNQSEKKILNSKGDPNANGGLVWRNAEITTSLPLAATVQGGFLGHEKFSVQEETESPWVSGIKAVDMKTIEKGIELTIAHSCGITRGTLTIETISDENIQSSVLKFTVKAPENANMVSVSFESDENERFYGFGSPTWTTQHRGNSIPIWVTEQLLGRVTEEEPENFMELKGHPYDNQIPIPFFMSSNGYGILLDTTYRSLFEMCTDDHPDSWSLETWNNETSFYVFTGDQFIDLLKTYTAISGRPDMPPDWFFGPMNDAVRGESNVLRVAQLIRDNHIPSTVIWTEDWLGIGSQQTGFRLSHDWDASTIDYPNLETTIDTLHADGFKFLGYFSPFIPNPANTPGHNQEKWQAANDNKYYFLNPEGSMREMLVPPLIPPAGGGLDLTNSEAVEWYKTYVRQAAELGLDGAMVDFGEWVPFDAVFADGRTAPEVHNDYPILWQKVNREVWDELVNQEIKEDYLFYVRSGYAGSQQYAPVFWAGDQNTNWDRLDGMASVITMGINLGLSGMSYFGHDIGGYSSFDVPQRSDLDPNTAAMLPSNLQSELWDGVSSKELFLRWAAIGAFSPMMRTHHGSRYGQNWSFEGGPNPENFTITASTITAVSELFANETLRGQLTSVTLSALDHVSGLLVNLQDTSYGTWVDFDKKIRSLAGDAAIDRLADSNLYVAKLVLRYAQQNVENLSQPKYDAETLQTWKKFAQLHIELFPYLKAYAKESADDGLPMMRHMILLYPDDEIIQNGIPDNDAFQQFSGEQSGKRPYNELFQYFLGNELLVAPIIDPETTSRPVYLPQGTWYNMFTREQYDGGQTITAEADLDEIPVFVPAGSIIPRLCEGVETLVDVDDPTIIDNKDTASILRVDIFDGCDGSFTMADGTTFHFSHQGTIDNTTTATVNGENVSVTILDKAIQINTPLAANVSLVLSSGSRLDISNAFIDRTYQICIVAPKPIFAFPDDFMWGTATAAHQVESDNTNNDWYAWEELHRIKDSHSNMTGPDHWNNYELDFDIAKNQLGTNTYRMSIEWSKIEPEPDSYSQAVIDHYHAILDALIQRGIKPVVSLQHFSLPLWIHDPTPNPANDNKPTNPGWNDDSQTPYIIERIEKFSRDMAQEFGSKIDWWITINEPLVMYANGFLVGDFPPGVGYKNEPGALNLPFPLGHHDTVKESLSDAHKTSTYGLKAGIQASKVIFPNIIHAHVRMYNAIKDYDTTDADGDGESSMVSISKHHVAFRPIGIDDVSLAAYNQMQYLWNEMIWDAIIFGKLDSNLDHQYDDDLTDDYGSFPKVDYIGFNYYARRDIVPVSQMSMLLGVDAAEFDFFQGFPVDTSATGQFNELLMGNNYNCLGWEIYPQGMKDIIIFYSDNYAKDYNLPIMITENGTDNDADRPGFVVDMIELMGEAMQAGHNVIGYLHWSLMDNFEWERGYGQHFGLVRVDFDYENKQSNRTVTEGGEAFASIIKNHGIVQELKDQYGTFYNPTNIQDDQDICAENQGETPDDGKIKENWETALDGNAGSVTWSITKESDASIIASGEGAYGINAYGNDVTVSFPFENIQAIVVDSAVYYTATGTAFIKENPVMTSAFTYVFDLASQSYKIYVEDATWQGLLDSHPLEGQAISTLVSGTGITSTPEITKWEASLDTSNGEASWEVIDTENVIITGEGTYYLKIPGSQYTVSFPFENVSATLTDAGMSFTASGTATIVEMSTMTSGYTFKLDADNGTYEISVDSATWKSLLPVHPIVGSAEISPVQDTPGPSVKKGDSSPLTMKSMNGLDVFFRKNGTFALYQNSSQILSSLGDSDTNGGILWRNAQITPSLPLAGTVQGGFLGHEKFSVESETEAPWISATQAVDMSTTEKSIQLTLAHAQGITKGTLLVEEQSIEGIATPVIKVTIKAPEDANHISCSFGSDENERFYGFGSPTWTTQHRGNSIPIWVTEQLLGRVTDEDPSNFMELKGHPYDNQIPIPFFMSSNGYGILLDTTYRSLFEMCTDDHPNSWRLETWNNQTSFYIFTGETFIDLIRTYTALSGRPDMPPDWFFGPMNDAVRGDANVLRVAKLIRDHDIPSTVIWTEDWLGLGSQQTGFRLSHDWDASTTDYPTLTTTIDTLHTDGFKFLGYFSPFIPNPETTPGHNQEKWQTANDNTYFFLNPQGTMREMLVPPLIPPAGGGLDLTKSAAVEWYKTYVRQAAQLGLDGAMVDFGEWVPFDAVFADGRTAPEVHNEYPLLWQKANREVWDELVTQGVKDDYLFYVRSGYAGSQKYAPAFWAGDQNTNWDRLDGMASVITMGLNLGMSGIAYFGHDIGGYSSFDTPQIHDLPAGYASMLPANLQSELWDGVSSKELFLRWAAIGAYSPMMRTHHGSRYGQNWSFEGGPNPDNFTITATSVAYLANLLAGESFRSLFSEPALTAIEAVQSVLGDLVGKSYGTWIDIDTDIRNRVGDSAIDTLAAANLHVAKLILRYAQINMDKLAQPEYDAETLNTWKKMAQQHISLFPYLKTYAKMAAEEGIPIMRHMILLYPDDEIIQNGIPDNEAFQEFSGEQSGKRPYNELFQYFLGNELLVAPIIDPGTTTRPVYLPKGTWYHIFTRKQYTGNQTISVEAELDEIPVFASAGSIIPRLAEGVETLVEIEDPEIIDCKDKEDNLRVEIFDGSSGSFTMADGTTLIYTYQGAIDTQTSATVNGENVNVTSLDKAIQIQTPIQNTITLVLSSGSRLDITNAPVARSYQICFISPKPIFGFSKDFLWGTATAAHQVESDNTNNDWYAWEELNRIKDSHSNITGPDHWNNYELDFDIAKNQLGTNTYRMSIEWSKIEPTPDTYDQDVIAHYHAMLDALIQRGIKPVVSLQHFSLPLWIHDPTPDPENDNKPTNPGWNDSSQTPYIVERIVKFTQNMAQEFGSKVDWWITINEPLVMYANGYLVGDFPPGVGYKNEHGALNLPFPLGHHDTVKENLSDVYKTKAYGLKAGIQASQIIFPNIIRAHVRMYNAIKEYDTVDADADGKSSMVSISKHHVKFRPIGIDDVSLQAYNQMQYLWNEMIWDAIIFGKLDSNLDQQYDDDLTDEYGSFPKVDYIGFNYYARRDVVPVAQMSMLLGVDSAEFDFFKGFPVDTSATGQFNELLLGNNYNCLGWEIYPQGMKDIIIFYSTNYAKDNNLPIMITENGTDNDADRPGFVVDMIELMGEAMQEGHNVIGYLHWSLMDNFEWERGYGQHFGLVRVDFDYENKQSNRTVTEGGEAFASIIQNNGILQELKDQYGTFYNPTNIRDDQDICSENQGGTPDDGKVKENWETALDGNAGSVVWSITKESDGSIIASGEGAYGINAMGNDVTVSFPFENIQAIVSDSSVAFTATGTAAILEMPTMTSGYMYVFDSNQQSYKIFVDSTVWQGLLNSHPIVGEAISTLVSGSGITGAIDATKWEASLDTSKGNINWEIISQADEPVRISGEGLYYISAMGQNLSIVFPFENVEASLLDSTMSFTAEGTATIVEMPTMTSGYVLTINGVEGTYEISVTEAIWAGMLEQHPITGSAKISQIIENQGKTIEKGDGSPLTTVDVGALKVLLKKNGTFSIYNGTTPVLKSQGDPDTNGGLIWRNAEITAQLNLAATVQGGFLGHEKFSVESDTQAPWTSAIKATDFQTTDKSAQLTIAHAGGITKGTLCFETHTLENSDANVMKVTLKAPDDANHVSCSFSSDANERFYGFGSPTWTTQHRGNSIPIWVTEQLLGRVTEEAPDNFLELKGHPYDNQIPIPFFMSSNGYGIMLDTTYRSLFELCTDDHPDSWRLETWNHQTSFYIFTGDTFIDLLRTYTAISGRADMPPDWFFGPMNDAVRGTSNVLRVAQLIRDNDIPSTVIWTEDWLGLGSQLTGFRLSHDWDVSTNEYPDLSSTINTLHADGFKFLGYFSPFIPNPETTPGHNDQKWQAANDNTYFFLNPEGSMREMLVPPLIPPHGGGLDLTKSAAVEWYKTYVRQAAQLGLDGAMVDFGEWVPFDAVFADGRTAPEVHNEYPLLWQKANREVWDELVTSGVKDDYLFYVRSGYTGSQKYAPAFWAGDQNTNWDRLDGMASVITMGLNLGLSGISYFGHDIGGYSSFDIPQIHDLPAGYESMLPANLQTQMWDGVSSKELFLRWAAIGAYSPMMRTHHGSRYGQNWSFEGGPNPDNFTITSTTVALLAQLFAKDSFRARFPVDALTAINEVQSAMGNLVDTSYGTWIDIDTAIRNQVGDSHIDTLASANLNVAKLILRYAQINMDKLTQPQYDTETLTTWKKMAQQHIDLFPYLKAYAKISAEEGLPIMRHMILLYPNDPIIQKGIPDNEVFQKFSGEKSGMRPYNELFQYFFGNELLVAPMIEQGKTSRPVYLPEGTWFNIFTRRYYTGQQTIVAEAAIDEIPVYAKSGSIVPRLADGVETLVDSDEPDITDYKDTEDTLKVDIFSGANGSFILADGTTITYNHSSDIDNHTTALINNVDVNITFVDGAFHIETPPSTDISLEFSNGSSLAISNSPMVRTYVITFIVAGLQEPENHRPLFDAHGREIILRGVNARIQGVFDVSFDDGREPLEPIPSFSQADTEAMQKIGFNLLRLPINWSGIEPTPNTYDQDYINHIKNVLDLCDQAGIQVMLDMHQDAFSKEIGEDGAPLWAIIPEPVEQNQGGHLDNLVDLRFSGQVQNAFISFWNNTTIPETGKGLQDHFIDAMCHVMDQFKDHSAVLGMEVFNEPWLLHTALGESDISLLHNFYTKAFAKLREVTSDQLIFFEPDVSKNFPSADSRPQYSAIIPDTISWNTENTVYAPHLYVENFIMTGNPDPDDPAIMVNVVNSIIEADAFQAPLMIGEFGFNHKDEDYAATMDKVMNIADQYLFHTAQWVWKENSQDAWGFYDFVDNEPVLRNDVAESTSRAYPQAISGRIKTIQYNKTAKSLSVHFTYTATGEPHVLFVPINYVFTNGYDVICDDAVVAASQMDSFGRISVECGVDEGELYMLKIVGH
jgi:alpha-glucosidase (family GH31 glycosyl hydrolase)/beta-glucosidase/6-phospho-beta-glucosidase/beta-galactosidase